MVETRVRLEPRSPLRLPGTGVDGTTRGDRTAIRRLMPVDGAAVVLTATALPDGAFELGVRAPDEALAAFGVERGRFWLGTDDDLSPFLEAFADDELIGASVQEAPHVRPFRRPLPFEVLTGAVCEQLITDERATDIKRAIIAAHGPKHEDLRAIPEAAAVAALAPADLQGCGLAAQRAISLRAAAREVASGRVDLLDPARREAGWRRLRSLPGIGPWTLNVLALHGQGVPDALPAGDHAYQVVVARLREQGGGRGGAKASEQEVAEFFERYRPWRGVAGWHVLRTAKQAGWLERPGSAPSWARRRPERRAGPRAGGGRRG